MAKSGKIWQRERILAAARSRTVTLQDVAREADVAVSTVSRALANPDRVSGAMRERIQEVARRLGYPTARIPVRDSLLALMVSGIGNPYNAALIRGVESQARAAGASLVVGDIADGPEVELAHIERLNDRGVDGIVLASSLLPEEELRAVVDRADVVLFNRQVPGFASVLTDSRDGSRQIVEHLAALGHRSIAYLSGPPALWTDTQRWRHAVRKRRAIGPRDRPSRPVHADTRPGLRGRRCRTRQRRHRAGGVQRLARHRNPRAVAAEKGRRAGRDQCRGPRRHLRRRFLPALVDDCPQRRRARRPNAGRPGPGSHREPTGHPDRDSRPSSWCGNRRGPGRTAHDEPGSDRGGRRRSDRQATHRGNRRQRLGRAGVDRGPRAGRARNLPGRTVFRDTRPSPSCSQKTSRTASSWPRRTRCTWPVASSASRRGYP